MEKLQLEEDPVRQNDSQGHNCIDTWSPPLCNPVHHDVFISVLFNLGL